MTGRAGPGPRLPPGNLHSQEQCFIKTGKIIEEKCACKGTGIYRERPCLDPRPERINWGAGDRKRGTGGAEPSLVRPPRSGGSWDGMKGGRRQLEPQKSRPQRRFSWPQALGDTQNFLTRCYLSSVLQKPGHALPAVTYRAGKYGLWPKTPGR